MIQDTAWYRAPDQQISGEAVNIDRDRKVANRIGGTGTLNMWVKALNINAAPDVLLNGIATFPFWLPGQNQIGPLPFQGYGLGNDGISVDGTVLPGATNNGAPIGRDNPSSPAHEIGHWVSVFHP